VNRINKLTANLSFLFPPIERVFFSCPLHISPASFQPKTWRTCLGNVLECCRVFKTAQLDVSQHERAIRMHVSQMHCMNRNSRCIFVTTLSHSKSLRQTSRILHCQRRNNAITHHFDMQRKQSDDSESNNKRKACAVYICAPP
jgi:hypothetical protein